MTDHIEPTLIPQTCGCCGQMVKLYRRSIYRGMARQLIRLVEEWSAGRTDEDGYVHVSALSRPGEPYCDLGKLYAWAPPLVDDKQNTDTRKRCSGLWKPTPRGVLFVEGKLRAARYVYMFNQMVYEASVETISISDALGEEFNYADMMATAQ